MAQEGSYEPNELAAQLQGEFGNEVKGMLGPVAGRTRVGRSFVARHQFLLGDIMLGGEPMQQQGE